MATPDAFPPGWVDGAPTSGRNQSCAFCGAPPTWVHPLNSNLVTYLVHSKGHTLPSFWALCDRCEHLYLTDDDEAALAIMNGTEQWGQQHDTAAEIHEHLRQPLAVFRRADRGARRLTDPPR